MPGGTETAGRRSNLVWHLSNFEIHELLRWSMAHHGTAFISVCGGLQIERVVRRVRVPASTKPSTAMVRPSAPRLCYDAVSPSDEAVVVVLRADCWAPAWRLRRAVHHEGDLPRRGRRPVRAGAPFCASVHGNRLASNDIGPPHPDILPGEFNRRRLVPAAQGNLYGSMPVEHSTGGGWCRRTAQAAPLDHRCPGPAELVHQAVG